MKKLIYLFTLSLLFISCKEDSNPISTEPPNPFAQKDIDWPSLQKAPWPMYRHDPQLTGRSPYVGPSKGIIVDTIKFHYLSSGVSVDKNNNVYILYEFDTAANLVSYNINLKKENWRMKLAAGIFYDNPNVPSILSNQNILVTSMGVYSVTINGVTTWQMLPQSRVSGIATFNSAVDKNGNIYVIDQDTKILTCYSPQGNSLWTFSDPRLGYVYYTSSFSPDGKILYLQCWKEVSILALDIETREVKWTFGTLPLVSTPVVDNQGNIYFQKSTLATPVDTFFCLNAAGEVRWEYIFYKGNETANSYFGFEPMTIDKDGNIYLLAPRDTLVSLTNDGQVRWKFPLTAYKGSAYHLVCDANGTVYFATISNHLLAVSNKGNILWALKLPYDEWYSTPSITEGKLLLTGFRGRVYLIE